MALPETFVHPQLGTVHVSARQRATMLRMARRALT